MSDIKPYYSRDELVAIIDDFYTFLTTFYIPESALKRAPPTGWPNITPETTKGFRKSQAVIDLIKHLPYIDETEAKNMKTNIHFQSDVLDYSVRTPHDFAENNMCIGEMGLVDKIEEIEADWAAYEEGGLEEIEEEEEEEEEMDDAEGGKDDAGESGDEDGPAGPDDDEDESRGPWNEDPDELILDNMIVLSQGHGAGGRDIILDVVKGVVHEDVLESNLLEGVEVKSFFRDLRERYETLEMVPVPGRMYEDVPEIEHEETVEDPFEMADREKAEIEIQKRFKQIYREHGWPGQAYKKEEALAAVEAFRRRVEEYEKKIGEQDEQGDTKMEE
jgi:hypothetical protein